MLRPSTLACVCSVARQRPLPGRAVVAAVAASLPHSSSSSRSSRSPALPQLRSYARAPHFTTPEEGPAPATPASGEGDQRVSAQAEQVLDSYASPFNNTATSAYTVFRYAVFGSVFIVVSSLAAFTAVHLYVEHVALAGPAPHLTTPDQDPDEWALAEQEGWTGAHTARRGGTDPRLGLWTRMAIRAAWMSQNWGSGTVAAPDTSSGAAATAPSQSPFAVSAPRRIGDAAGGGVAAQGVDPGAGRQVHDAGWIMAERYLAMALQRAQEKRGISLVDSVDWESHVEHGGVDRAAVELEERLAGIRERIGGRARLHKAREGWERIYYALAASPSDPHTRKDEADWERREKLRATRKMGELSARIADSWQAGTYERESELERAQGWLLGGVVPLLAGAEGQSLAGRALDNLVPSEGEEPQKHVSPVSSFFGFWSRSHPPATAPSSRAPAPTPQPATSDGDSELDHLVALLSSASSSAPFSPATQRALLASLISLETHLARRASTAASAPPAASGSEGKTPISLLQRAHQVQAAALAYAQSLAAARPLLPASVPPSPESSHPADLSQRTSALWISTRLAALETHLAECSLALALSGGSRRSGSGSKKKLPVDLADADALLHAVSRAEQTSDAGAAILAALETSKASGAKDLRKVYEEPLKRVRRDADRVVEMGTSLSEVVAGLLPREEKASKGWFK
ncbi:hypothetical protein JCM8202_002983 [Rhodotorula sphaerocarpa]